MLTVQRGRGKRKIRAHADPLDAAGVPSQIKRHFYSAVDAVADPDFEPIPEELAGLFVAFRRVRRFPVRFDPHFVRMMEELERRCIGTEADADDDTDVDQSEDVVEEHTVRDVTSDEIGQDVVTGYYGLQVRQWNGRRTAAGVAA